MTQARPLVFVSYRHMDDRLVLDLVSFIKAAGAEVWLDKESLHDRAAWVSEARIAFEAADVLLVCYTQAAVSAVRGAVFLEWQWFVGRDPQGPPGPVIAQLGHQSAPPSQFPDIEPVPVFSESDFPVVMAAILDAAQGNVRRRSPVAGEVAPFSIWDVLARFSSTKATPRASRWRDALFAVRIRDVRADLLDEQRVVWRRHYLGRPAHSVLQRDLVRAKPFAMIWTENDRVGAVASLLADLTTPGSFSYDDLGFVGLLEQPYQDGGIDTYLRLAEALLQSLRSRGPVELKYERAFRGTAGGQPLDLRFVVCIRIMPVRRMARLLLSDRARRRQIVAESKRMTCSSSTDLYGAATSHVIAHIRYCRVPFIRKGESLEARVGINAHKRLEALLADGVALPNNLELLASHTMWRI